MASQSLAHYIFSAFGSDLRRLCTGFAYRPILAIAAERARIYLLPGSMEVVLAAEYDIVSGILTEELIRKVNAKIREGWQPLGGLCCVLPGKNTVFMQAVVKGEKRAADGVTTA